MAPCTAPIDVSSGDYVRHRLNRGGSRRLNYALHIAALVQVRLRGPGRHYYLRKRDAGKTSLEEMRCLKRRLSDVVFRALLDDPDCSGRPQNQEEGSVLTLERAAPEDASAELDQTDRQGRF